MVLISFEIKRCKTFAPVIVYKLLEKKRNNQIAALAKPFS